MVHSVSNESASSHFMLNVVTLCLYNICHRAPRHDDEVRGGELYLEADLAGAYEDLIVVGSRFVDECLKRFLHTDGGTAAVDVTG